MNRIASFNRPAANGLRRASYASARRRGFTLVRKGFTLVEMVVTIGIILVLMAIGVVGFQAYESYSSKKTTASALANGHAQIAEMEAKGSLTRIEGPSASVPAPLFNTGDKLASPGDVNPAGTGRAAVVDPAQRNYKVHQLLQSIPSNANAMKGGVPLVPTQSGKTASAIPLLADAWGNPLVFVPSGGMTGVTVGGNANLTITSTGATTSPQNRPFWASAGPDGSFTTGDDNIYSFQR